MAEILVAFYVDNGLIASRDPVWLQESFDILIGLFERIGLFTNAAKTKVMTCIPGRIREGYTEEEYADYKSQTVTAADKKRHHVDCEIFGASHSMIFSARWSCKGTSQWIVLLWYTMLLNRSAPARTSARCRTASARQARSGH